MKTYARLHLYPHREPRDRSYIVAEPAALRALSDLCRTAAHSMTGVETATFFGSDGHEFEIVIVSDVAEEEWQQLPLPGMDQTAPRNLSVVQMFDELVTERQSRTEKV